jgi:DNA-binding beta-propeller fold protein YncE
MLGATFVAASLLGIAGKSPAQINPVQQRIAFAGPPFAAITSPDGKYVFVSLGLPPNSIAVIRQNKTFAKVVQNVPVCGGAYGLAMTKDGRYLIAVVQPPGTCPSGGVQIIDVKKAIAGDSTAVMPTIQTDPTAVEVAISPDQKLLFVANEHPGSLPGEPCMNPDTVSVIDFNSAITSGQTTLIGTIPVDCGVVGLAVTSDNRYLYVTNETALPSRNYPDNCENSSGTACPVVPQQGPGGVLAVVDIHSGTVVEDIPAGCQPTRVILTNHDKVAWVSARDSNSILAFDTQKIMSDPANAQLTTTPVGTAPDGAQPFYHNRLFAIANTNRFDSCPGAHGTVSILDFAKALKTGGSDATLGMFDAGVFPHQWAISPNGKLLYLTEYGSDILAISPVNSIVDQLK